MKKQIKVIIFGLIALGTVDVHAQTQKQEEPKVDLFTQVSMTQEFLNSMINQASSNSVDRLSLSADYGRAAPIVQENIKTKLDQFRKAISSIFGGSLGQMVTEFNQAAQDKNTSPELKAARMSALKNSIIQMAKASEASYQAQLKQLFILEGSFCIARRDNDRRDGFIVIFADGTKERAFFDSSDWDNYYYVSEYSNYAYNLEQSLIPLVRRNMDRVFMKACETQTCYSNLFNDYASYFYQIENFINKSVVIKLADGTSVEIRGLKAPNRDYLGPNLLLKAINSYIFPTQYTNLPFSN